jgi:hypothetical protein
MTIGTVFLVPPIVKTIEEVYPHLRGINPVVDHRSANPKPSAPLPAYGAPMRGNVDRTVHSQANADSMLARQAARQAAGAAIKAADMQRLVVRLEALEARLSALEGDAS